MQMIHYSNRKLVTVSRCVRERRYLKGHGSGILVTMMVYSCQVLNLSRSLSNCLLKGGGLAILGMVLLVGCGGGGGGSSAGGGGGDSPGDGGQGSVVSFANANLEIIPAGNSFNITLSNYPSLGQNVTSILVTVTAGDSREAQYIFLSDLRTNMGRFVLANLTSSQRYNFTFEVVYSDGSLEVFSIAFEGENNGEDHDIRSGILLGPNYDGDRWADDMDTDDDGDGIKDDEDRCAKGETGWRSNDRTDADGDGCRDMGEDMDDDNDGVDDSDEVAGCQFNPDCDGDGIKDDVDECVNGETGWRSGNTTDFDGDGCRDTREDEDDDNDGLDDVDEVVDCVLNSDCDNDSVLDGDEEAGCVLDSDCDNDSVLDGDEEVGCVLDSDCDNDSVSDGDEAIGCVMLPDCDSDHTRDNEDIDADGDGLIEIGTAAELDAVRYVLNGTGFKATAGAQLNQTGCGNGADIRACSGYELIGDISLTDYIAANYATQGWQPIAHDTSSMFSSCQGDKFNATFDGNGFEISGLRINRPQQDCIGLFGRADGKILNLGVEVDSIKGNGYVGGLVGNGESAEIFRSYVVSDMISGEYRYVGGLAGSATFAKITQSYAVNGEMRSGATWLGGLVGLGNELSLVQSYAVSGVVNGGEDDVGGLVGESENSLIVQSYAISGEVRGGSASSRVAGLIGMARDASIIQSYAVSSSVSVKFRHAGGLLGDGGDSNIAQSYAVSGPVNGTSLYISGLVGQEGTATASYWDIDTSGRTNDGASGSSGQPSSALISPTGYDGLYATWDDGAIMEGTTIAGVDHNGSIWCDKDLSGMIEEDERRDDMHAEGDNRIWDFGTSNDYPAIRCTLDSPADQRAWWSLNSTGQPAINQDRLDAWLDGSLR